MNPKVSKFVAAGGVAASGSLVWLSLDAVGTPEIAATAAYWVWTFVAAVCVVALVGVRIALLLSVISALTFAGIPAFRMMFGMPADFRGIRGFVVLLEIGVPVMFIIYSLAALLMRLVKGQGNKTGIKSD